MNEAGDVVQGDRNPKDGALDHGGPGKLQKEGDRVHEVLEISWKFYILPFYQWKSEAEDR